MRASLCRQVYLLDLDRYRYSDTAYKHKHRYRCRSGDHSLTYHPLTYLLTYLDRTHKRGSSSMTTRRPCR